MCSSASAVVLGGSLHLQLHIRCQAAQAMQCEGQVANPVGAAMLLYYLVGGHDKTRQ